MEVIGLSYQFVSQKKLNLQFIIRESNLMVLCYGNKTGKGFGFLLCIPVSSTPIQTFDIAEEE